VDEETIARAGLRSQKIPIILQLRHIDSCINKVHDKAMVILNVGVGINGGQGVGLTTLPSAH
jgi:hypothetical protein